MRNLPVVEKILRKERKRAAYVPSNDWYELRVAPSCPPDKQIHLRGGRIYLGYNWGWAIYDDYEQRAYTVPDLSADLSDVDSVAINITFTNADYYQFFFLQLQLPAVVEEPAEGDWSFYLHGTLDEFETAGEAEEWLDSYDFQRSSPWDEGSEGTCYPLCGVVLRNDGQVGVSGAFLPIDMVNRGRSYIWPTDMRPLQDIYS
jgi:hypothetical protein